MINVEEKELTKIEKIKKLWNNKQTHALIVLGMWLTFFALVFVVLGIMSLFTSDEKNLNENKSVSVVEKLDELNYYDYDYEYIINDNNSIYSYKGEKTIEKNIGYYESLNGIVKYEISDGKVYKINNELKEESSEIITSKDYYYTNLVNIKNLVRFYENDVKKIDDKYILDVNTNDAKYYFEFTFDNDNIKEIKITVDNTSYELDYKNVKEAK